MPNIKVTNLSTGVYRSDSPEQIPETSWFNLVNMDIVDEAIESRDGYSHTSTTGIHAGCLQLGYNDTYRKSLLQNKDGDFGFSASDSSWNCFFYAKEGATTISTDRVMFTIKDTDDTYELVKLGFDSSNNFYVKVSTASTTFVTLNASGIRATATTYLYGIRIEQSGTTYTAKTYAGGVQVATTIFVRTTAFPTMENLWVGSDGFGQSDNFYGYFGELTFTKNLAVASFPTWNALPPGDRVPTANRIAHFPFSSDLEDDWGLTTAFSEPPLFRTGAGLSAYDTDDPILTSPTARNQIPYTKSWRIDTVGHDRYRYFQSGTPSTTSQSKLNPANDSYTITMDQLPVYMSSTSTSYKIFSTSSTAGPEIVVRYKSSKEMYVDFKHVFDDGGTKSKKLTVSAAMGKKNTFMFDYEHVGSTMTLKVYRNLGIVATTLLSVGTTAGGTGKWLFGQDDTSTVEMELYMGGVFMHAPSVATTWITRPTANIRQVTQSVQTGTESVRIGTQGGGFNDGLTFGLFEAVPIFTDQTETIGEEGENTRVFSRQVVPNYENIFGMYFFNEVSGFDLASTTTSEGRIINAIDKGNANNTWMDGVNELAPIWKPDRNSVGLITTDYLGDRYRETFDNSAQYLPTKSNLGDKQMLLDNNYLMDDKGNSYQFDSTWGYGQKSANDSRSLMYGNSMYSFNKDNVFRYNGRTVLPIEQITPTMQLTVAATTASSGINGAYMYAPTFVNKNGLESRAANPTSVTVATGSVSVRFQLPISTGSHLYDSVESINIYRNKGSVGTTTSLVNNNGTLMYLLRTIPIETAKNADGGILFYDKVSDSSLGRELVSNYVTAMPPNKFATIFRDSAVFTGDETAPNHYYISQPEVPEVIDSFGDFRTEDGEKNTAVAILGTGFMVFKSNARKYVPYGDETRATEWPNGGCIAQDSLVSFGDEIIGMGSSGFFRTNGHRYTDINRTVGDGRVVSSIEKDVDAISLATKNNAYAVYHEETRRYICLLNDKLYIYHTDRNIWRTYEDFVGLPIVFKGDFYIYNRGWLWKETSSKGFVGDAVYNNNITSGSVGSVVVVSTTAIPTTNEYGLPCYIDNTFTYITDISVTGSTYTIQTDSNVDFSSASEIWIGSMEWKAQWKYFEARTPEKTKMFSRLLMRHQAISGGNIHIRYGRDSGTIDQDFDHFVGDTTKGEIKTWVRCRARNFSPQYSSKDGNKHLLRSFTIEFEQQDYGY